MKLKYVKEFDFPSDAGFTGSAGKQMVRGYARGGQPAGQAKVGKVMGEFGKGKLHSGSKAGPLVKNPKQAVAIALSEARKAGAKIPVKRAEGGPAKDEKPKSAYLKPETEQAKKAREERAQALMERAEKNADKLARGPGYEEGGKVKPAVMPGRSGSAPDNRPVNTGLARAAEMSGRTMPVTGRPAMKKGGKVKKADGGMVNALGRPELTGLARAAQMSGRTMPVTGRHEKPEGKRMESKDVVSRETKAGPRSMMERSETERMRRYEGQRPNRVPLVMKKGGYAEGGKADLAQDKRMVRMAVHKHEKAMHPGKPMTKLKKGGMAC